jgi:hypothetical protein
MKQVAKREQAATRWLFCTTLNPYAQTVAVFFITRCTHWNRKSLNPLLLISSVVLEPSTQAFSTLLFLSPVILAHSTAEIMFEIINYS